MIMHVFNNQVKFSRGYFQFLYDNGCDLSLHELFHYGKKISFFESLGLSVNWSNSYLSPGAHILLLKRLLKADKVVIHCLASPLLMLYILFFPTIAKKCVWILWGKDVYYGTPAIKKSTLGWIYELFRKMVIPKISNVATSIYEDYQILTTAYKTKPNLLELRVGYPYSIAKLDINHRIKSTPPYIIQVGNSGSRTNQHIDCYKRISKYLQYIDKVYTPLSYGANKKYYDEVCRAGNEMLGTKHIPMMEFIEENQYFEHMENIDIFMMNHNRQEAYGNILSALYMKKTVYIRSDQPLWAYFKREGIVVNDILEIESNGVTILSDDVIEQNFIQVKSITDNALNYKCWTNIFSSQMLEV